MPRPALETAIVNALSGTTRRLNTDMICRAILNGAPCDDYAGFRHSVCLELYRATRAGLILRQGRGWYAAVRNLSAPVRPTAAPAPTPPPVVELAPEATVAITDAVSAALNTLANIDPALLLTAAKRLTRDHMKQLRDCEDAIRTATAIAIEEA